MSTSLEPMTDINVRTPVALWGAIREQATAEHRSASALVRDALRYYLDLAKSAPANVGMRHGHAKWVPTGDVRSPGAYGDTAD
jgi:hypothetical protein